MSDPIVQRGQVWLNATYGGNPNYSHVEPNGLHGSAMSAALVSAMQIELGTPVSGVFGDITKEACDRSPLKPGDSGNRVKIMQYGFYNKGYNAGTEDGSFNAFTKAVVREIQEDAGLAGSQITDQVDGLRMGAILGVDEYKLVSGGDVTVRTIQKTLNQRFVSYTGLKACDGHYGRSTNEALIYAIQALEGMSANMATGFFGPSTKNYLPDLWQPGQWGMNGGYSAAETADFTRIAQYALYCVGIDRYSGGSGSKYNPGTMDGSQNSGTLAALHAFQNDHALSQRDMVGLDEWMGLLVSTGNPDRDAGACDCSTQLVTPAHVAELYSDDYRIVGRYLTGTVGGGANKRAKNLTSSEIQTIFDGGMSLFCIYQDDADWWQDHSDLSGYFGYSRGFSDASKAINAAFQLGIPFGEYIYFAVDHDFMEGEVYQKVVPHFQGISEAMGSLDNPYKVGIYSARNTCGIVSAQGLASSSFVSDMSTGYSGNLGYPLPSNWAFDQIQEYPTRNMQIPIDKNVVSGRYQGFDRVDGDHGVQVPVDTKTSSTDGTTPDLDLGKTVKIGAATSLAYYGSNIYNWATSVNHTYRVGTASIANLLQDQAVLSDRISKVTIEVTAGKNTTFNTIDGARRSGCFPPVVETLTELEEIERRNAKTVLDLAVSLFGNRYVELFFATLDWLESIKPAPESTTATKTKITQVYRWDRSKSETAQYLVFHPTVPKNTAGSFVVKYTVETSSDYVVTDSISVNIAPEA